MVQSVAQGSLVLTIDEAGLEARLDFVPDPQGAEWTGEKLQRLAMDARISGLSPRRAEELVGLFMRARGPVRELLARGQAPEPARPEEAEWEELPLPEEYAEFAEELLLSTPPPELYLSRTETIKVEKRVERPGALPFLPPRVEKVLVTEKRETRERVYPDPEVRRTGFARAGERLGILSQAKPGKPGKSIFGQPIPASQEEGSFVLGRGLIRSKNELLAEYDGILRAGSLWAELLPLELHRFSLRRSADGASVLLDYRPGHPRLPAPRPEAVLDAALELGASPESLLSAPEIATLLSRAAYQGEALEGASLSLDRDSSVEVKVSPDGLKASLSLRKGRGRGRPLELAAVSAALKEAGIKGLRTEELKKAVLDFYKGEAEELLDYPLAEGRAPTRGKDRSFQPALAFLPRAKAAELLSGLASHPSLTSALPSLAEFPIEAAEELAFVQAGQRVGEIPALPPGQAGYDVRGQSLPGIPGNDPIVKTYENLSFAKGLVTASIPGLLLAAEKEGAWSFRVLPYRDASIEVQVSPDAMEARVSLQAEEGLGSPLSAEKVLAALAERGVVKGIEPAELAQAVAAARAGEPVIRRVVARGRPPVPPLSAKLEWLVRLASGAAVTLGADGKADYRNQDRMTRVSAGDAILRVERAGGEGEPGLDLLGRPVQPEPLDEGSRPPEHDASILETREASGALVYAAAVSGELLVEKGRMAIRERFQVKGDLGPATGNLRFPGAVQVSGAVLSGYQLFSGADVQIGGAVEAALVSSEGTVRIGEGVKGRKRGTVRAKRSIEAVFAEQALLLAVEDLRIKNSCILCNVKTNGRLLVSGERGAVVGGIVRARKGLETAFLGSENGIKTEVSFGQDYLVADMIAAEEAEIAKIKAALLQAERALAELGSSGPGLDRMRQDKVKLMKLLEKRTLRIFDFREKFEEHFPSEVRVRGTVYPGVILESHNRFYEVAARKSKVAFVFEPGLGRIVERPL